MPRAERKRRVAEALELVRLGAHGSRRPSQLSGGQPQRVALARAIVNRSAIPVYIAQRISHEPAEGAGGVATGAAGGAR